LRLQFASEGDHFASVNPALRGAIARHNLGVLYREEGRDAEAETYWQAVVADHADYLPSWIGLAELYLSQGRSAEFEEALAWLEADGRAAADAAMLRARAVRLRPGRDDR
jgi:tetratricopeptide (TPR) repeat protein